MQTFYQFFHFLLVCNSTKSSCQWQSWGPFSQAQLPESMDRSLEPFGPFFKGITQPLRLTWSRKICQKKEVVSSLQTSNHPFSRAILVSGRVATNVFIEGPFVCEGAKNSQDSIFWAWSQYDILSVDKKSGF